MQGKMHKKQKKRAEASNRRNLAHMDEWSEGRKAAFFPSHWSSP
jgi:hypothetical protein